MGATGSMIVTALAGGAGTAALMPKPPKLPDPVRMPDPLGQQEALQKALLEQTARRGRLSTILTEPPKGTLGG